MKQPSFRGTVAACYVGYITQAVVNNFLPLVFVTLQTAYAISLEKITLLVTVNFLTQLLVDLLSAKYVDRIGYRAAAVAAHVLCALGLIGVGVLPGLLPSPYAGLLVSVVIYAVGGGLIEVLISPIVEACPAENKSAAMSLLHSFYCWGCVAVIALSTACFAVFGRDCWPWVACGWAVLPAANAVAFARVPIRRTVEESQQLSVTALFQSGLFWVLALLMVCAGASEQAMSQWASAFAEKALRVSKTVGDLAGPCFFAVLMGLSRVLHAKLTGRVRLERYIAACAVLCLISYAMAVFLGSPAWNLLGCGLTGFAVGVFWPGTFSIAAARLPKGGDRALRPAGLGRRSGLLGRSHRGGLRLRRGGGEFENRPAGRRRISAADSFGPGCPPPRPRLETAPAQRPAYAVGAAISRPQTVKKPR